MRIYRIIIIFFINFFIKYCVPVDPNLRTQPLQNSDYTGFISREFFQVVVEVPIPNLDLSIEKLRLICYKESLVQRDLLTLPILRKIASINIENQKLHKADTLDKEETSEILASFEKKISNWKKPVENTNNINPLLYSGDFHWFLEGMFLYKEDYSNPEKCKFIYRNISKELYKKVEDTKLSLPTQKDVQALPSLDTPRTQNLPAIPFNR
jgi:hypothetical protein